MMEIALFDLDNTLLGGDSDYMWGQFLIERGIVEKETHERENQRYYQQYMEGTLDIYEFIEFQLAPLAKHDYEQLLAWREEYIETKIKPIVLSKAVALVEEHRQMGRELLIITATNRFITEPIAKLFGIEQLLATEPEFRCGQYTGQCEGVPCFQEGKVKRFEQWMEVQDEPCVARWFYSDSHNDIPLLSCVETAVAVDPDDKLARYATLHDWPIISLRDSPF